MNRFHGTTDYPRFQKNNVYQELYGKDVVLGNVEVKDIDASGTLTTNELDSTVALIETATCEVLDANDYLASHGAFLSTGTSTFDGFVRINNGCNMDSCTVTNIIGDPDGEAQLRGHVTVGVPGSNRNLNVNGNATITGSTTLNGLSVSGSSSFTNTVSVNAAANLLGSQTTITNVNVTGTSALKNTTVTGNLNVSGSIAGADTSVSTVSCTGSTTIGGALNSGVKCLILESGTKNALEVRNTGTGYSLLVEDETNPDGSPFVIDNAGRVGIGKTPSTSKVEIVGDLSMTGYLYSKFYGFIYHVRRHPTSSNRYYTSYTTMSETYPDLYGYFGAQNKGVDSTGGMNTSNMTFTCPLRGFWRFSLIGHGTDNASGSTRFCTVAITTATTVSGQTAVLSNSGEIEVDDFTTSSVIDNRQIFNGVLLMALGDKIQFRAHSVQGQLYSYIYYTGQYVGSE